MRCAMLSWIIRQLSFVERCPLPSSSLSFAAASTPDPNAPLSICSFFEADQARKGFIYH